VKNDALGQQESRDELPIEARRPHDDREGLAVDEDLKRFLDRGGVGGFAACARTQADDRNRSRRSLRWS
jgi:hypothetical protein